MGWVLSIISVILLIILIYFIRKGEKDKYSWSTLLPIILAALLLVSLPFIPRLSELEAKDWVQSSLTFVLVVITGIYACFTFSMSKAAKKQADASTKITEEMQEQRFDSIRPVIDIQLSDNIYPISDGLIPEIGELSYHLPGILSNIGVGPAIDVYTCILEHLGTKRQKRDFGTIAPKGKTAEVNFALIRLDKQATIITRYKDIYGRSFESSLEINRDSNENHFMVGPLKIRKIPEEDYKKLLDEAEKPLSVEEKKL